MNYKEYQERQNKGGSEKEKTSPKKQKFPKPSTNWDVIDFMEFLSEASGPISLLAVISMLVFWKNLPIIPAILSLLIGIFFWIRYKLDKCHFWLPAVWLFNTIIWSFNSLTKLL
jgi:hypothetical protein